MRTREDVLALGVGLVPGRLVWLNRRQSQQDSMIPNNVQVHGS
jgi:hypothetical protein